MRFFVVLSLLISIPLFADIIYYESNKSGMLLEQVEVDEISQFYITREVGKDELSYLYRFYEDGIEFKQKQEFYNHDFTELSKVIYTENSDETIEIYKDDLLISLQILDNDILQIDSSYNYNKSRELIEVEYRDINGVLLYSDSYSRNLNGSLRQLSRSTSEGYYNHWFYQYGTIIESWLTEGLTTTRTKYDIYGKISSVIQYKDEVLIYEEVYIYDDDGVIIKSSKITGDRNEEKIYNRDGYISEYRILEDDILVQKTTYEYNAKDIVKEVITGHGKLEEYLYKYDEANDLSSVTYYLNRQLKSIKYLVNKDFEVFEYYRNNMIYLKESFFQGERTLRDLYLDGKLFKSESNNE